MKYSKEHLLDGPIELVMQIGLDRDRDVKVYPNVTKLTVKSRETKGDFMEVIVETVANGDIPPALRKFINPKMLTWTEYGRLDIKNNTYEYKVKPLYFTNICKIYGKITYKTVEPGKTLRRIDAELVINMPIVGAIAEKKIAEVQLENLDRDVAAMREEIKEMLAAKK